MTGWQLLFWWIMLLAVFIAWWAAQPRVMDGEHDECECCDATKMRWPMDSEGRDA